MPEPHPKVFCVGFHKTGTTSMQRALQRLGYRVAGPFGVLDPEDHLDAEVRASALEKALAITGEVDAAQDNPWPLLYRELDDRFPGSRFVLTVRDPERWFDSALRHFGGSSAAMRQWIYGAGDPLGNKRVYVERFERHNREVRAHFAERAGDLLEMNLEAGDGWAELCAFLGHPVPEAPFPHARRGRTAPASGG